MSTPAPIIIKRIIKKSGGHHGGSWKVAFADFATAMMAFFLLLWILTNATPEQLGGISQYFENPSMSVGTNPAPSTNPLLGEGGSSPSVLELGAAVTATGPQPEDANQFEDQLAGFEGGDAALDRKRLEALLESLREATEQSQALSPYKDQLLLDITPQGLRIQIIDKENRPMFGSGSAVLQDSIAIILKEITSVINAVPNRISITGHTDAYQFIGRENYSNWELSSDRANAARRQLMQSGLAIGKVQQVTGFGDSVLFVKEDPYSPVNRRISIVVLTESASEALQERTRGPVSLEELQSQRGINPSDALSS